MDYTTIYTLPRRPFFSFRLKLPPLKSLGPWDGSHSAFGPRSVLPNLQELERFSVNVRVLAAWHPTGLALGVDAAWSRYVRCDVSKPWTTPGMRVFLDTRDTRDVARATRFCQVFNVLPTDDTGKGPPQVSRSKVTRAKEDAPAVNTQLIRAGITRESERAQMDVFFPAEVLPGYDPAAFRRLGLFVVVNVHDGARWTLTAGDELEYWANPQCWASCELA